MQLARNLKAFLNLEAGIVRGEKPDDTRRSGTSTEAAQETERLRLRLEAKEAEIARLKAGGSGIEKPGIRPENIVWIFGMARTGSTWLNRMMGDISGYAGWKEPLVGALFGQQYYMRGRDEGRNRRNFILADLHMKSWLNSIRTFVLSEANAHYPDLGQDEYLIIQEPNGSIGAPLLMQALPESRMVFLIRDPRDAVASSMDSHKKGGWAFKRQEKEGGEAAEPDIHARNSARKYLQFIGKSKEAYELHTGPKVFIRYEELRADTLGTMERIYLTLGLPVEESELKRIVEKHSWEKIPEDKKGSGKPHRKATPGGWKDDLTPKQIEIVEQTTAPLLKEFYPGR
jgi:hypothetical protein